MPTPKWPGDHHEKHSRAAKLGWARRKATKSNIAVASKSYGGSARHTEKKTEAQKKREKRQPEKYKAAFIKEYGVPSGNRFMQFEVERPDGSAKRYDIKIREGRNGSILFSRSEAKEEAIKRASA